jgi:hypothetical protein
MKGFLKKWLGTVTPSPSGHRAAPRQSSRLFLEMLEERLTPAGGLSRELPFPVRPTTPLITDRLVPLAPQAPFVFGAKNGGPSVTAQAVSATQVNLSWQGVAEASAYRVDEWVNDDVIVRSWIQIGSLSSGSTSYAVTGLSPGTTYYFDVGAIKASGVTWSDVRSSTTFPAAPSFTATAVSPTEINLSWDAVASASSYLIDQSVNGAWQQIGSVSSPYTSYAVTGLSPGTTYAIKVAAVNAAGTTWAATQSALTFPDVPLFWATPVSPTQINLGVNAAAGATSYLIDMWVNGAWKQLGSLTPGNPGDEFHSGLHYQVVNLNPGGTYFFEVAAVNASGATWAGYRSASTPSLVLVNVDHPAAKQAYTAVTGSLFGPSGHPSYLDVQQGAVGDCSLMASLAEVAARAPTVIEDMFTYEGTALEGGALVGVYTVRFFTPFGKGMGEFFVTVDTELPGGVYGQTPNGVLWPALAEKAYAQANGKGLVLTNNPCSDSYDALGSVDPSWALSAITGEPASDLGVNPNTIADAWNAGKLIVLRTSSTSSPPSPYIVGNHAYAVVGYDPSRSTPFEVYNPWGTDPKGWVLDGWTGQMVYGLFNASAAFLSQNFSGQSVGWSPPAAARIPATGFARMANASLARTIPGGPEVTTTPATAAHESDQSPGDAFWRELGTRESAAPFLGPPWFSMPGGSEGTPVRATGAHEFDRSPDDVLWTEPGTLGSGAPFLGPPWFSMRVGR